MKNAYEYLRWAIPEPVGNSYEQLFYDEHCSLFNLETLKFNDSYTTFSLIKSDIVLRGLLSRQILNKDIEMYSQDQLKRKAVRDAIVLEIPYLSYQGERIYVPTYDVSANKAYYESPDSFKEEPLSLLIKDDKKGIINPFTTYGLALFDSPFTRLTRLDAKDDASVAFYHLGYHILYIINENGDLREQIPLLDDRCKENFNADLLDRVNEFANIYYQKRTIDVLYAMKDLHLVSPGVISEAIAEQAKIDDKKNRKERKKA